jgi:adenosylmethionine-8-amino-7-oxononanoate aminotransferase
LLRQLGDTVVIMPPLSISTDEIDTLVSAAAAGITAVTQPLASHHRGTDAIPRS